MITWNQNMEKNEICYMDTDKFIVYIKAEGIYSEISKDVDSRYFRLFFFKPDLLLI